MLRVSYPFREGMVIFGASRFLPSFSYACKLGIRGISGKNASRDDDMIMILVGKSRIPCDCNTLGIRGISGKNTSRDDIILVRKSRIPCNKVRNSDINNVSDRSNRGSEVPENPQQSPEFRHTKSGIPT